MPTHRELCDVKYADPSWSFVVRDENRDLNVVSACPLRVDRVHYAEQADDFDRSFHVLRGLPADIWVTSQARAWGRYRKFVARDTAKNAVDPFIDPEGFRDYVDDAETALRQAAVH